MGYRRNSQRQLLDYLTHRVVEIIQFLPFQSPVESGTDLGACRPEFNVDQVILGVFQFGFDAVESQKVTYPDCGKDNDNGTKYSLGWCVAHHFLRDAEDFDEPI